MNVRRLFWKIFVGNSQWNKGKLFGLSYSEEMCSDEIMYAAITIFGVSIIYSDSW